MGGSPQVPTSLHSPCPRLSRPRTLILGRRSRLGSNESGVFPLLGTEESPRPEGNPHPTPPGERREDHRQPRGHEVGGTCVPGGGAGIRQRLGSWGRRRREARAGPGRRRCSGVFLLSEERKVALTVNKPMLPACIPAGPTWQPPASTRCWLSLPQVPFSLGRSSAQ